MANNFQDLRNSIKGVVLTPGDDDYLDSLKRWSEASVRPAAVVVQPDNAEEVSKTVQYATAHKLPFAVVSGGHATSGSSSSDGGMVLDLRRINSVRVDAAQQSVTFGGGCRWAQVDEACAEHGMGTVGGTVNHTGVGGFILGGGMGWLTPRLGLTIDNLLSAQVVLADGSIVTASDAENEDLFWALRGAGQNFGVSLTV
jgi:FAD/FMN-containing dehydrogenase